MAHIMIWQLVRDVLKKHAFFELCKDFNQQASTCNANCLQWLTLSILLMKTDPQDPIILYIRH